MIDVAEGYDDGIRNGGTDAALLAQDPSRQKRPSESGGRATRRRADRPKTDSKSAVAQLDPIFVFVVKRPEGSVWGSSALTKSLWSQALQGTWNFGTAKITTSTK